MVWSSPLALRVAPALAEDESPAAATLWGVWTSALFDRDDVDAPDGWSADAAAEVVRSVGASDYATRLDEASRRWEGLAPAARDVRARLVSWIVAPRRAETDEAAQLARLLETSRAENERLSTSVAEKDVLLAARERDLRSMRLKLQPTTPLDEALAAQVDRADRSETEAARHKTALDAAKTETDALRTERDALRASEEALRRERAAVEDESTALADAYNALENEYRKVTGGKGVLDKPEPGEISRLRDQLKAADDWMAVAVTKMDALGSENAELKKRAEDATPSQSTTTATAATTDTTATSFTDEVASGAVARLETKVERLAVSLREKDDLLRAKDDEAVDLVCARDDALARLRERPSVLTDTGSTEVTEELERLRADNESVREWMANAYDHQRTMTATVEDLTRRLEEATTKDEKEDTNATPGDADTTVINEAAQAELEQLRAANDQAQQWTANAVERQTTADAEIEKEGTGVILERNRRGFLRVFLWSWFLGKRTKQPPNKQQQTNQLDSR